MYNYYYKEFKLKVNLKKPKNRVGTVFYTITLLIILNIYKSSY